MAHILCRLTHCKHNQNEGCMRSVIDIKKQAIPETNIGYAICHQFEKRENTAIRNCWLKLLLCS